MRIVYWVRSIGPNGKDRVPMVYKGRCRRSDEGIVGVDVRLRPQFLGDGDYTVVVNPDDCENEDGTSAF